MTSCHTDPASPVEQECKTQQSVMNANKVIQNHQDIKVDVSFESSHVSESKEVELLMSASPWKELDSSFKWNYDNITNVSDKLLPQAGENCYASDEDHECRGVASNFCEGIPLIEVSDEPRKSSLDEEELKKFMEEMKLSFQNAPSIIDSIDIDDLKPPDFYRSVSRSSMDQELEDLETVAASDCLRNTHGKNLGGDSSPLGRDKNEKKEPEGMESTIPQAEAVSVDSTKDTGDAQPQEDDEGERSGYVRDMRPRLSSQNCMVFTRRCSYPTNESPSPPLSSPSTSTNPPTPSAGPATIYTAEVNVVQRSLPPTPAPEGESLSSSYSDCCPEIHKVVCPLFLQVGRISCARIPATH